MMAMIRHRGPDEAGTYVDGHIAMGNVRLSIIDVDGGTQPMGTDDGRLWIVYNGEVFNYLELRAELSAEGAVFATRSDTEVVLKLYERHGPKCLSMLNGQFAMAIWDAWRQRLFLARDRVGIRPLYYFKDRQSFIFGSEIKAVFANSQVPRQIDPEALADVFTWWVPAEGRTIFRGISELPPGHYMTVERGSIERRIYWDIPYYTSEERWPHSLPEAEEALREKVIDAVRLRLRADMPVGAYASGGLDSSIITSLICAKFDNTVQTFSIGFDQRDYDERPYQQQLTEVLGVRHKCLAIDNRRICEALPRALWHCETPLLRSAPIPLMILSALVRDSGYKVVLTGEGADEVFGGYNIFKETKIRNFCARQPSSTLRPLLFERIYPYVFKETARGRGMLRAFFAAEPRDLKDPFFSHRVRWRNGRKVAAFLAPDLRRTTEATAAAEARLMPLPDAFAARDPFERAQYVEMKTFLARYLLSCQGDRVAMANSLEIRLPFLDYRIIDFGSRLPRHWKMSGLNEKYILKHAFGAVVPPAIAARVKQPYRAPIADVFLKAPRTDYVNELLSAPALRRTGYFDPPRVARLLAKFDCSPRAHFSETDNMAALGILSTQLMHHQFVEDWPQTADAPPPINRQVRKGRPAPIGQEGVL